MARRESMLAGELFDEWLAEQLPFTRKTWTNLLNTWLKPKTKKQLWNNLDDRSKRLIKEAIRNEFVDYPLNGSPDDSPMKTAMWFFRRWLRHYDWQIGFLSGNRPWCKALEKVGVCFVKKRTQGDNGSGLFQLDEKGVIILRDNGREAETYSSVLEAVLIGGWSPD